jgi:hypothetical protein
MLKYEVEMSGILLGAQPSGFLYLQSAVRFSDKNPGMISVKCNV